MPPKKSKKAPVKKAAAKKKGPAAKKAEKADPPEKGKKHTLDSDDESDDSSDSNDSAGPPAKKAKKSGPIAELRNRATQLGIEFDPSETVQQLREKLDNWLDDLENGLREFGLEKNDWANLGAGKIGKTDISTREKTEPRWEKRQAAKEKLAKGEDAEDYSDLDDIDPFRRTALKNHKPALSTGQLMDLENVVRGRFLDFLRARGSMCEDDDSIKELFEYYLTYGGEPSPYLAVDRELLELRCKACKLDHIGKTEDLIKRLLMYDITSLGTHFQWEEEQVDASVNALGRMPPGKLSAAQKAAKAAAKEEKAKARKLKKIKDDKTQKLLHSSTLTIGVDDWQRTFNQINVSGAGFACMWRAIAHAWLGDENLYEQIHARTMVLWNAVMNAPAGTTNPALQTRRQLYAQFDDDEWTYNTTRAQWGDVDTAQLVADALDIQIFMYSPDFHNSPGETTAETVWGVQVRGRDHTRDRQVHIVNYPGSVHWTALTDVGDDSAVAAPPVQLAGTAAGLYGLGTLQQVPQLPVGDPDNTDLRDPTSLDGHVADTREREEDDDDNEEGEEQTDDDDDEKNDDEEDDDEEEDESSDWDSDSDSDSVVAALLKAASSRGGKGGGRGGRGGGAGGGRGGGAAGGAAGTKDTKGSSGGTGATKGGPTWKSKGGDSAMGTPETPKAPTPSPLTKAKAKGKVGKSKLTESTLSSPPRRNRSKHKPGPNRPRPHPQGIADGLDGNRPRPDGPRLSPNQPRRRRLKETSTAKPQGVTKAVRKPVKVPRVKGDPWKATEV